MIRVRKVARFVVLIAALGGLPLSAEQARAQERREAMGPLRVHPRNPRYFADGGGRAVYLTGSHTWANLRDQGPKDPPKPFDYEAYLGFLVERNHNVIRLWAWEQARWAPWSDGKGPNPSGWFISPNPYARTGPGVALDGKPKFDLEKWDDAYFERLRTRVRKAGERGIYVSVMLFQGWRSARSRLGGTPWRGHPYHPENNIQGWSGNTKGDSGPALDDPRVRERQAAYIHKVVDTSNDLDNVLYEVTNEGGYKDWDHFVVESVHADEKTKPKQHPLGLTGHGSEDNDEMLASPAAWLSPGSSQWPDLKADPRAVGSKKVSLLDNDHVFGVGGDQKWVWKAFLRGDNVQLKVLREQVRRLVPERLATASFGGHDLDEADLRGAMLSIGLDFVAPHRPREAGSADQTVARTRACLATMRAIGRLVPIHYQEPFRRAYGRWQPTARDFLTDLRDAVAGGAAGWYLHNGSSRGASEERPRRSFDLHARQLFDQLDEEEREVVDRAAAETHRAQTRRGLEFRHHFASLDLPSDRGQGDYGLGALADLDRDGDLDFVCGGRIPRPERLYWFEYRGPEDWVRHDVGTDYRSDVGLAALDVDGDGWVDLVCSGLWYRNPGKPREAAFERIPFAEGAAGAHDVLVADVDGDGRADVLMMGDSRTALNALCWFRIPADLRLPWVRHEIGPGIHGAITPAGAFDVDGDSDLDVARGDTWYENRDGKGLDWRPHKNLAMGRSGPYGVCVRSAVADLDGDGRPELVVADADIAESRVAVLWNRGGKGVDWRKQELPRSFRYGSLHALAAADLNGDGRPDIVVNEQEELLPAGRDHPRWVAWENVGEGRFAERVLLNRRLGGHELQVGDVDGDGDIDIVSKPWSASPSNGVGGKIHVDYLENRTKF